MVSLLTFRLCQSFADQFEVGPLEAGRLFKEHSSDSLAFRKEREQFPSSL